MRIAFRTDASLEIGTGHVMRCLTLADALRERGSQCSFICRPHHGHLLGLIAQRGHQILVLPTIEERTKPNPNGPAHAQWLKTDWVTDAQHSQQSLQNQTGKAPVDWLVVDHYALDARWEYTMRPQARRIMVIDDLADRNHSCDFLLDQNLGRKPFDYKSFLKGNTKTLIGPQYALLSPEFALIRSQSLARRQNKPQLARLLITMGGVDINNTTGQLLNSLQTCKLPLDLHITIVMGPHAPWLAQVQAQAAQMRWSNEVLVGVSNMAQLMADSDLAIGAAGGSAWERCSLGLPSFLLVLAKNQLVGAMALQKEGAAIVFESDRQIVEFLGRSQTTSFLRGVLEKMSYAAAAVTDGEGCARIVDFMMTNQHD